MLSPKTRLILALISSAASLCHATPLYWDGADLSGDPFGGTGTWNTTTANWDTAEVGGTGVAWTANDAFLGGTAGVVTLGTAISATTLNLTAPGYTLAINSRAFSISNGVFSTVAGEVFSLTGTSGTTTIGGNGNLTSAQSVRLSSGKLQLQFSNSNSPLGAAELVVNAGILNLRKDGANDTSFEEFPIKNRIRLAGDATVNADRVGASGGTGKLLSLAGLTIGSNTLTTSASPNGFAAGFDTVALIGNATFSTAGDTWIGAVTESGGARTLLKTGTGTLVFRSPSTWSGGLTIGNGDATALATDALGTGTVTLGAGTANSSMTVGSSEILNDIALGGTSGTRTINARNGSVMFLGDIAANALPVTVNVGAGTTTTLSGALSGSKSLTKSGTGTLYIFGDTSSFGTGAPSSLIVSGGLLQVDSDFQLGLPGNGVRLNGGGLLVTSPVQSERTLDVVGGAGVVNVVDTTEAVELEFATSGIAGSGPLLKRGKGMLLLAKITSANIGFSLNDGELKSYTPSGAPFGGALKLNFGTLTLAPYAETLASTTLTSQAITFGGSAKIGIDNSSLTPGGAGTLLATFSSAGLTRIDHGTIAVTGLAGIDFLGGVGNDGERWKVTSLANADFYPPYIVAVDADAVASPHFVGYSTLYGFRSAQSIYSEGFNFGSATEIADVSDETLADDESVRAARIGGLVDIDPDITLTVASPGSTAGLIFHTAGQIRGGKLAFGPREAVIYVAADEPAVIESDIIATGEGGFTKFGPGTLELVLQNGNGNLGEISVHEGALAVDTLAALGSGTDALRIGMAEFSYNGATDVVLGRDVIIGAAGGAVIRATSAMLTLDKLISGGEAGTRSTGLTLSGGNSFTIGNLANTFVGDLVVDGVELFVAGQDSADPTVFGAGQKDIVLANSAKLTIATGTINPPADTKRFVIDGSGEIYNAAGVLRLDNPNQLAGNGVLRLTGNGTTEIGEIQGDFLGSIVVEGGELRISGKIPGSVTAKNNSTFAASGKTGPIEVFSGATLSPGGTAPGRAETSGLNANAGSTVIFDIHSAAAASGHDQVAVKGSVAISGSNLHLALANALLPTADVFYLITNDGTDPVTGTFSKLNGIDTSLPQGASFVLGGRTFEISYTAEAGAGFAGVGNDVAIRFANGGVLPAPEIVVTQNGSILTDGVSTANFGSVNEGAIGSLTFLINNSGNADLTGLGITIDGPDAAVFSLSDSPTSPVPGPSGTTSFTVLFTPTANGSRSATLHIASNDADEASFDIALNGTGANFVTPTGPLPASDAVTLANGPSTLDPLANDGDPNVTITSATGAGVTISADGRRLNIPAGLTGNITYTTSANRTATITILAGTPVVGPAKWQGLLYDNTGAVVGQFSAKMTRGKYTASVNIGHVRKAAKFTPATPATTAFGELTATLDSASHLQVTLGTNTGDIRPLVTTATPRKFTSALRAIDPAFLGGGYAQISTKKTGATAVAGVLPDGTKFTAGTGLADNFSVSVFAPVKATNPKGTVAGQLTFAPITETDVTGELAWLKPPQTKGLHAAGVDTIATLNGSIIAPSPAPTGTITGSFNGGNFPTAENFSTALTLGKAAATASLKKLTISGKTGILSGAVLDPLTARPIPFKGVYLPKSKRAWGFIKGATTGGRIEANVIAVP